MAEESTRVIRLFHCYAHEDKALRNELDMHLFLLKRQHTITTWYDRDISPGAEWKREIDTHLTTADIILLLVSPNFMASDYCYGIEMQRALVRHEEGTCCVIPVILRSVDWEDAPFSKLQVLPTNALAINSWSNRDEAFADVAKGIRKAVMKLLEHQNVEQWLNEGQREVKAYRYQEAIHACEQALKLEPDNASAHECLGDALYGLNRFHEALASYQQAFHLNPQLLPAKRKKGDTLTRLNQKEQALITYSEVLALTERFITQQVATVETYSERGEALNSLKRYEEALTANEQAIRLDPNFAIAYSNKGNALTKLGDSRQAKQVHERARQLGYNG